MAIESLVALLESRTRNAPPAFPYAYAPVLDLLQRGDAIISGAGFSRAEFQERLAKVSQGLVTAWGGIADEPRRLAAFSIPPSKTPDPTLVHNWAYITLEVIKETTDGSALSAALVRAEQIPELSGRIQLAQAINAPDFLGAEMDSAFRKESSDVFYQALGHRLNLVRESEPTEGRRIVEALLSEVLRRGPRELDLAVFVAAPDPTHDSPVRLAELKAYRARLRNNATLQRAIGPAALRFRLALSEVLDADED